MADVNADRSLRPFPNSVEDIDRGWITSALRVRHPGVSVGGVEIIDVIRGACTKVRLRLDLDDVGTQAGIPETVFLKGGFEEHSSALDFLLMTESLGYRDLLSSGALNAPACYFADYDPACRQGIIIMEDLTARGAQFGDPMRPRTPADIRQSLSLLAQYHSRTWGCAAFTPDDRLGWVETVPPFSRPGMKPYLEPESWERFRQLPRGAAVSTRFLDREWAVGALAAMDRLSARAPNCVIHGDTHLGNMFFVSGGPPGFYDVVPRRAPAMAEVGYHIALTLDVADRRQCERELVGHYLDEVRCHGIINVPDLAEAMHQYGAFLIEGFCLVLLNDTYFLPEAPTTAYAARLSAAMIDNNTARLLSETP